MKHVTKCSLVITCLIVLIFILWFAVNNEEEYLLNQTKKFITFHWTHRWGFGNEMFALAATLGINHMMNNSRIVCLHNKAKIRKLFDLQKFPVCSPEFLINRMGASTYREVDYAKFDPEVKLIPDNVHVVLDRFFQSWRYFNAINPRIRKLFKFSDYVLNKAKVLLMDKLESSICTRETCESILKIGVHVRRKDLDQDHLKKLGYVQAPKIFFYKASMFLKKLFKNESLVFVICSDDVEWAELNLRELDKNVVFVNSYDPTVDLAVMASCDHSIISVGTFGWWAAWLVNGTTIYYKDWPERGSSLSLSTSHDDYFLKHWIPL